MKKLLLTVVFPCFFLCQFLFAKSKIPQWMLDINSVYPFSSYIAQTGEGDSKQTAELNAAAGIAKYFESNIEALTIGQSYIASENDKVSAKSDIDMTTVITSNVSLFAIQYSDCYRDKKTKKFYSVAYINRNEAYSVFRPKIDLPAKNFSSIYQSAEASIKDGNYLSAVKYLKREKSFITEFEENYQFALLLNPEKAAEYKKVHEQISTLDAEIIKNLQRCQLEIEVQNDFDNLITVKAENLFSSYGFPVKSATTNVSAKSNQSAEGKYKVIVNINTGEKKFEKGTSFYPEVNVNISGKTGSNDSAVIFSFGKEGEKVSAVNEDMARKRAYNQIEKLLEEAFYEEFYSE